MNSFPGMEWDQTHATCMHWQKFYPLRWKGPIIRPWNRALTNIILCRKSRCMQATLQTDINKNSLDMKDIIPTPLWLWIRFGSRLQQVGDDMNCARDEAQNNMIFRLIAFTNEESNKHRKRLKPHKMWNSQDNGWARKVQLLVLCWGRKNITNHKESKWMLWH